MLRKIAILWLITALLTIVGGVVSRVSLVGVGEENLARYSTSATISEYDHLFKFVAAFHDMDWRLLSAIAYQESRFKDDALSPTGAVGLMQIMPRIAVGFGLEPELLEDAATNIDMACTLMLSIEQMLRFDDQVHSRDRVAMVLASYNGGIAHMFDARRLAEEMGLDRNRWIDVKRCLLLKNLPENQRGDSVRNGKMYGATGTVRYVDDVMDRYDEYCLRVARLN